MEEQLESAKTLLSLRIITIVSVCIILVAIVWAVIYIHKSRKNSTLSEKQHWIDELPSLVSALGVLGTFVGITVGLYFFNTKELNDSIPLLLEGLKSAFLTSICGMVGSMILNKIKTKAYDEQSEDISDVSIAAGHIVHALNNIDNTTKGVFKSLEAQIIKSNTDFATYYSALESLMKSMEQQLVSISALHSASSQSSATFYKEVNQHMVDLDDKIEPIRVQNLRQSSSLENLETLLNNNIAPIVQVSENVSDIHNYLAELMTFSEATTTNVDAISFELKSFGQKLHDEVVDIEGKMADTNDLLVNKFTEFSDLLKKSNTEALVDVMKSVTEEFQNQMSALINKLVQENFEQLNASVDKLNHWQVENKEMISSLTQEYKNMADDFKSNSVVLSDIVNDTRSLVSEGGKLSQLINALSRLLIEDEHFIQITNKLNDTVELTKSNFEQFDNSTKALNEWVRKQRNFVDGVQILVEKLDELNKIRDYGEQFWQGTKKHMEEGVGFIKDGAYSLSTSLKELDQSFYNRLSATLAELDTCIQAMVKGNEYE